MIFCLLLKQQQNKAMFKNNNAKKLYRFSKHINHKLSASTKDLNDSLDLLPPTSLLPTKHHTRTQSCPSVPPTEVQPSPDPPKQDTTRSYKLKPTHRNCRSQVQLDSLSMNQPSISMDNLSSILYRKNSKQSVLKKSKVSGKTKFKPFTLDRGNYEKVRIDQQIKKYELNEQLSKLQKNSKGISLKQQILQTLLHKFDQDILTNSQSLIDS